MQEFKAIAYARENILYAHSTDISTMYSQNCFLLQSLRIEIYKRNCPLSCYDFMFKYEKIKKWKLLYIYDGRYCFMLYLFFNKHIVSSWLNIKANRQALVYVECNRSTTFHICR